MTKRRERREQMSKKKMEEKQNSGYGSVVHRLFKMLRGFYPVLLPCAIILIIFNAIVSAVPSIFIQKVVAVLQVCWNQHLPWSQARPQIMKLVAILAVMYGCSLIAGIAYNQLLAIFTQGSLAKTRNKMFDHMQTLPIRYFDTNKHGDIMSYYTNDVEALRQMISQSFPQLLSSLVIILTILCIMFYYSIWMALIIIAGSVVTITITKKIGGRSARYFIAQQKSVADTEGVIEEMIGGEKVIKVFNHEPQAEKAFDKQNDELYEAAYKANKYSNTLMPILNNVNYILYVIVAVAGGLMLEWHAHNVSISGLPFSIAVIVPFLSMCRQFAGNIQQVSPQINSVVMGLAGAKRIFRHLDEEPEEDKGTVELVRVKQLGGGSVSEVQTVNPHDQESFWAWKQTNGDGGAQYRPMKGDVRLEHVNFSYEAGKPILHDLTLYAKPGQKVAFVGATGAGKTTITNLINRFYDISDGTILYDGIDIHHIQKPSLRKSLGIVLQDTVLFTGTVMDNIRYGRLDATDEECIEAAKLAGADDFIERLPDGYQTMLSGDGSTLSQGQCQLLAIARAAAADPPVMILDEATSSIDTRTEQIVQKGMDALMKGRTVFVIAHRLSTVKNSNVIIVLDHGRIIERGTHEQLLDQKGQYYQLYTGAFELE
jgi:ATP-binding cassette subfamily B multidrug efflux pump